MFDFQFYTTTTFQIDKMELKNRDEIKLERVHFSHENKILTDLVQQARDSPNLVGLTDDQLLEKVENILLEKIQNGEKQAYFQLGLFYYEQVCGFCLQIQAQFPIPIAWLAIFFTFLFKVATLFLFLLWVYLCQTLLLQEQTKRSLIMG